MLVTVTSFSVFFVFNVTSHVAHTFPILLVIISVLAI